MALSSTLRLRGPEVPRAYQRCGCGAVVTRPRWGLRPNSPQQALGIRIDPPPSPPIPTGTMPVATATAVPPLDPPGVRLRSQALCVMPRLADSVEAIAPNSGMLVVAATTAPARLSR